MDPVRVLLFLEASTINGAARSILNFCEGLHCLQEEPQLPRVALSVATFHRGVHGPRESPNEFVESVRKRGIPVHVIPERFRFDTHVLSEVRQLIERVSPHVVQTNNVKSHFLIKKAAIHRKSTWIACHHGYTATDWKVRCYNQFDRWSLRSAKCVITACRAFAGELLSAGVSKERIRVIHNAARIPAPPPPEEIARLRERFDIDGHTRVLLAVGRLSREKGHRDLIHAMHRLRGLRPNLKCKLVLVGFGPEKDSLTAEVQRLALRSQVTFAPDEKDVMPFFHMADAFVLPSHSEGSPHVIFEAMAAGTPLIATCVGGIPEIVKDGETGILVPPNQPAGLASAIMRVMDVYAGAKSRAESAKELAHKKFSLAAYARSIVNIYVETLFSGTGTKFEAALPCTGTGHNRPAPTGLRQPAY